MGEEEGYKRRIRERVGILLGMAAAKRLLALILAFALALPLVTVSVEASAAQTQGSTPRIPDLRMGHTQDFKIRTVADGRRLLRFTAIMVNVGAGPFEAHGQRPDTDTPTMAVTQRIYNAAGGYRDVRTPAAMFFSGDGHDHWHIEDLQRYTLRGLDGQTPDSVRSGAKQGFCVQDFYGWNGTLPGAPERAEYRANHMCGEIPEQEALEVPMGLSVGWSDIYGYYLPKQYVDITGLPPGRYRLYAVANWRGDFEESRERNNYTWTKIELRGNKVRVLKEGPSARYCGLSGRWC